MRININDLRGSRRGKGARNRIRKILRQAFGETCYWCGDEMEFPVLGEKVNDPMNMATIEHDYAKNKGKPDCILFLRLSHKRCNV